MRYEVRDSKGGTFELERDEPLKVGDIIDPGTMAYKVTRILPGHDGFDAVVEVDWLTGPGQGEGR